MINVHITILMYVVNEYKLSSHLNTTVDDIKAMLQKKKSHDDLKYHIYNLKCKVHLQVHNEWNSFEGNYSFCYKKQRMQWWIDNYYM